MRNTIYLLMTISVYLTGMASAAEVPIKPWGKASLEGTWDFKNLTPLNRPEELKDQEFLSAERIAKIEADIKAGRTAAQAREGEVREGLDGQSDVDVGYNSGFLELANRWDGSNRTSLIVDPPNGRRPAMTAAARTRNQPYWHMQSLPPAGPEMRNLTDRCLTGFNNNPMVSGAYNNIMQIVQSDSHVVIHVEMVNDHRVIPTDGSGAAPNNGRFWKGFSTGVWDGSTFVVTTTNFKSYAAPMGTGDNVVMTERFTRLDADTLEYEWTIDDPDTYVAPFTARQQMRRTTDDVYEYACHEGNYSLALALRAARKQEVSGDSDDTWMPSWFRGYLGGN